MPVNEEDPDVAAVIEREFALQTPDVRRSRTACLELLDPQFREFGASGREWDRASVLAMMAAEQYVPPEVEDLAVLRPAPGVIVLTYRARRADRTTLRSALWRRAADGAWRLMFHQGTVVPPGGGARHPA
ncbi:DUF4440 domain-containing protein [Amycolatopsis ultiminotia]